MVVTYRLFPCSWYLLRLHAETLSSALYSIGGKIQADKCSPCKLSKKMLCHLSSVVILEIYHHKLPCGYSFVSGGFFP
jgi:hypothetical protein